MAETPPNALPVISDALIVRAKLGALVAFIGTIVAAAIWSTVFYMQQQRVLEWMQQADRRFDRIESALGVTSISPHKESTP